MSMLISSNINMIACDLRMTSMMTMDDIAERGALMDDEEDPGCAVVWFHFFIGSIDQATIDELDLLLTSPGYTSLSLDFSNRSDFLFVSRLNKYFRYAVGWMDGMVLYEWLISIRSVGLLVSVLMWSVLVRSKRHNTNIDIDIDIHVVDTPMWPR